MLSDKINAKKQLFDLIATKLSEDGFTAKLSEQFFFRKTSFGKEGFHLSFLDRVYGFETMIDAAVRFNEVENIVNQFPVNQLLKDSERKKTFTVGTNFGVEGKPPIWEIEFEEEIPISADSIVKLLCEKGVAFLNRNSTLEGISETLKQDSTKGTRALTVAFLLRDEHLFNQVSTEQKILLEGKPGGMFSKFQILENELRKRWLE